ncbi:MAG: hypothetical protein ACO30L_00575 [Ilumatobacteraceae bacterium]
MVGRHVEGDQMVEVPASSMGIVRVVMMATARAAPASLTVMTGVPVAMTVTARVARASSMGIVRVVRGSLTAMIDVRVVMMATARAVRASLIAMTGVRVVMMATARAVRASLTVTGRATIAVRASSTATTGAHGVLIAAIATSRSVRRPTLIVVAQRSSSAKVVASTAKTTQSYRVARTTSGRSLTRGQCADRESGMFAATSGVQPTSALAINVLQIEETEMIGETGDISFLRLAPLTKSLRKKYVAPSVTDASLMSAARWVQPSMRMTVNDGVMRRSC